jgi:hypothetical protein
MVSNMTHARIVNGKVAAYPYTSLRADHPAVSFPAEITDELLALYGVYPVRSTPKPSCAWFERVEEVNPVSENGVWMQRWQVVAVSAAERTALLEGQWAELRAERDARLAACDWTQLPDSPVDKSAWASYRQALRDLPKTTSSPFEAVWPEEPR